MATQNTEVNNTDDAEDLDGVLTIDDLEDPGSQDVGDAEVADPENAPLDEEKDTPSEASTEETPTDDESSDEEEEEGDESETEPDQDDGDLKPVEGETPRERALREEVTRVKRKLRQERGQKLFKDIVVSAEESQLSEEDEAVLAEFDPEQVANMEKLLAVQAKKMGFVKKDELNREQTTTVLQSTLDDWLETHPELDEKNDPDGLLWGKLQAEYAQYVKPTNPKDLVKILNRAHKEVFGITTDTKGLKQVEAKKEKIKNASHSAAAGGDSKQTESKIDDETKQLVASGALKDFSDEDLKELGLK